MSTKKAPASTKKTPIRKVKISGAPAESLDAVTKETPTKRARSNAEKGVSPRKTTAPKKAEVPLKLSFTSCPYPSLASVLSKRFSAIII